MARWPSGLWRQVQDSANLDLQSILGSFLSLLYPSWSQKWGASSNLALVKFLLRFTLSESTSFETAS